MQRTTPPFRADHVGSLLRTGALKAAREQRARNAIDPAAFKAIEDREIAGVIAKQEAAGLQSITDGEYRRVSWNIDFLERLDNVESYAASARSSFKEAGRSRARCSFASPASSAATSRIP
jgi:5-methyltetrahydropteroyltriglutamate--homocysteine methyltransferase